VPATGANAHPVVFDVTGAAQVAAAVTGAAEITGPIDICVNNAEVPETELMARTVPVGRLGTPADAGAACVWLAAEESSWMTGATIPLDGGSSAG